MYPAEFHLQTLHLQGLELYSLFPWLFHPFWLLQKCCCLSKFQEESFGQDIPSVKGPVDQSSPLCKYRRCCVYCLYSNWVQDILFANNLISGKWMPKNDQITIQLHSFHMQARLCSKSFKLGFSSTWTENVQMDKLDLEKTGTRDQIAKIHWIVEKAREFHAFSESMKQMKKHLLHWPC